MNLIKAVILDDEPGITALCERLLAREGFETLAFTDPVKAVAHLDSATADILLVDIRMPVMSGFDVIAKVRQSLPDMAILVMTGYGTVETAIQALHEGVDGLVLKPFEKAELLSSVKRALDDKQKRRDSAQVQVLRPLFDVTEAMMAETRIDQLSSQIVSAASRLLLSTQTTLFQRNRTGVLEPLFTRGEKIRDFTDPLFLEFLSRLGENHAPFLVNKNGQTDSVIEKTMNPGDAGSYLFFPIDRTNFHGALLLTRDSGQIQYRELDLDVGMIFTRQAAVALENAKLYGELREYIVRIEESQSALVQAEKLATAGRMTASMAHEINNPLQSVQNCLHLAAREDLPPEMRRKYFELTQSELSRLMETVQRMLEFYRPNVERERVNVVDLVDNVLNLLGSQLQTREIRVTTSWPAGDAVVDAVSSQIQQVFINIILNSFDAMPSGGNIMISIQRRNGNVEIDFQDNGPGISEDVRDTIFEPFVSTKEKGSGLGLSVSYGIIVSHGGNLELITDRSPGACFRVTLPEAGS